LHNPTENFKVRLLLMPASTPQSNHTLLRSPIHT